MHRMSYCQPTNPEAVTFQRQHLSTVLHSSWPKSASLPSNKVRHKMLKSLILGWESDKNWRNTKARYKSKPEIHLPTVSVCRIFCLFLKQGTPVRFPSCSVRFLSLEKTFYPFLTFEITRIKILAPVISGRDGITSENWDNYLDDITNPTAASRPSGPDFPPFHNCRVLTGCHGGPEAE